MKKLFIQDLESGDNVTEVFLVRQSGLRQARNGNYYIQALLADRTGTIPVRMWDAKEEDVNLFPAGGFVKVQARVETYRNSPQMIVQRAKVVPADELDVSDFQAASAFDPKELEEELLGYVERIEDEHLAELLRKLFGDEAFISRFRTHPAATDLHHAFVGGLLEHTTMLAREAAKVCEANERLDPDLMIAGALLHDIGKLDEMSGGLERAYTDEGKLMGHLVIGVLRVEKIIDTIDGFPERLRLLIHHIILSHHGTREFGSPILPATPEAVALHHLDNLDAKVEAAVRAIETDPGGDSFTDRKFMFGNIGLYKLRRESREEK